jgi:RNA polymerase sigma-70 factor (ECF subfamily)
MTDRPRPRAHPTAAYEAGPTLTEAIARAQHGDEQAFRQIYRSVQPRLLNYVRAMVGETDAEDVAAEAWIGIARDLRAFHGDAQGFLGWTATIARHRATDHLRRRRPVIPLPHDQLPQQPTQRDAADHAEEILSTETALALVGQLPPDQAQAILLRVIMGLDVAATARILGKRPGAVRTAAHRGLRTLSKRFTLSTNADPPKQTPDNRAVTLGRTVADPLASRVAILNPAKRPG